MWERARAASWDSDRKARSQRRPDLGERGVLFKQCFENIAGGLSIRSPMERNLGTINQSIGVVRLNFESAIVNAQEIWVSPLEIIALRHLLQSKEISRVEFQRAFQVAIGIVPATLPAIDVSRYGKDLGIV